MISIFAGTQGFVDDLAVEQVRPFEKFLHAYMDEHHADLRQEIVKAGQLNDQIKPKLTEAITAAKAAFVKEQG